ncbi:Helicase conserved C-terminal domain-containing protein [Lentibacillus halodurans]|uniref:Helicase conserved C-terminal domain-containing protein n=1 Tax=Lentibacillus halodurans TaxID=237679 RepID=A0A1I0V4W6_9BACI|nr:SNF2-related protein [Lentibacillus halodurans]SFA71358.1 Helicase conserved C-terminal domain-containing protein [Lentibacillus halodurans]
MNHIDIQQDSVFINQFENRLKTEGPFSSWDLFQMNYQAVLTTMAPSFEGLKALEYLPQMDFLDHQLSCARQVMEEMNGRAILADEVGLGKTIEAGLILKEYMLRGLVKKALIIVPASLVNQWAKELNEKFYIPAVTFRKSYPWDQYDVIITSIDTAKRSPHREQILEQDYDFLLVDEAHKLKNHKTKNFAFIKSLKKKYCLLLTATPVQNRLVEIFNLVSILKPGHLGDYDSFLKQYGKDRKKLNQDGYLKQLIQKVMIRNTRQNTKFDATKRNIETVWIDFSKEEKDVYSHLENVTDVFPAFSKITLLRELCSSREACYLSLQKMMTDEQRESIIKPLTEEIEQLPQHVKAAKAVDLIKQADGEKVIVFTEYRATQFYLQWYLKESGITSVPYRGGFKKGKKDWMKHLFENHAQVLIATEAGGEGINLQFCNHLINYDLPWNPMRLEQRIGRIHRYGQENDVHIYNLAVRGTVEEHIMKLLYEKINLFEQIIGHLDSILAELDINDLESEIQTIFSESASTGEAKIKLDNLSSVIQLTHEETAQEEQYGN